MPMCNPCLKHLLFLQRSSYHPLIHAPEAALNLLAYWALSKNPQAIYYTVLDQP